MDAITATATPGAVAALSGSQPSSSSSSRLPGLEIVPPPVIMNAPTFIKHESLQFLILDAPHDDNVSSYIKQLHIHNVKDLVRTCERTYDEVVVQAAGIATHALAFPDGEPPSTGIINDWLDLVSTDSKRGVTVGVHCLAGLGRAPVLVVIALIELGDMKNLDAIELVRSQRKGAINKRQLQSLMAYKKQRPKARKWFCI